MSTIHFLNVLEGDCNIIKHDSGRISVIDISNADNHVDTLAEQAKKNSKEREEMRKRNYVPNGKINYRQKEDPDNPIDYLKNNIKISEIFRFILSHADMDHLDGIKDLYDSFRIQNTWDTDNNKEISDDSTYFGGYNKDDWDFYKKIRSGEYNNTKRLALYASDLSNFWNEDKIQILAPTKELLKSANREGGDIHDSSYVLLFTPPKKGGGYWKILFAGDSHDNTWNYILKNHSEQIKDIDVLFAPHHGRDSNRSYDFLKILKPRLTLFGNASSEHLAYSCYPKVRITNNEAGFIVINVTEADLSVYVKNKAFATNFLAKRNWGEPQYSDTSKAYGLIKWNR